MVALGCPGAYLSLDLLLLPIGSSYQVFQYTHYQSVGETRAVNTEQGRLPNIAGGVLWVST